VLQNSAIDRVGGRIAFWVERILALGLIAGIVLDFINVVGRYVSGITLVGVDEFELYIVIWIAFLGAVVVTWRGEHLRMDVLSNSCPRLFQKAFMALEMVTMFSVAAFIGLESFWYSEKLFALGAVSDILHVPTWIPHIALGIGFFAIALIVLVRGLEMLRRPGATP